MFSKSGSDAGSSFGFLSMLIRRHERRSSSFRVCPKVSPLTGLGGSHSVMGASFSHNDAGEALSDSAYDTGEGFSASGGTEMSIVLSLNGALTKCNQRTMTA